MVEKSVNANFKKSIEILIQYIKEHEKNPTEREWDAYAVKTDCLSSRSMGFIDGEGFNKMCKRIRKEIKKDKKGL